MQQILRLKSFKISMLKYPWGQGFTATAIYVQPAGAALSEPHPAVGFDASKDHQA